MKFIKIFLILIIWTISLYLFGNFRFQEGSSWGVSLGLDMGYVNGKWSGYNLGYRTRLAYEIPRLIKLHMANQPIKLKQISNPDQNKVWDFGNYGKYFAYMAVLNPIDVK